MSDTIITFQDSVASALKQLDTAKETLVSIAIQNADLQELKDEKTRLQAEIKALQDDKAKLYNEVDVLKQEKTELEDTQEEPFVSEPDNEEEAEPFVAEPDKEEDAEPADTSDPMEGEEKDETILSPAENPNATEAAVATESEPEEEEPEAAQGAVDEAEENKQPAVNEDSVEFLALENANDPVDDPFSQLTMMTCDVVNLTEEELVEEPNAENRREGEYSFENVSAVERQVMEGHVGDFSIGSRTTTSSKKRRVSKAFVNSPKKWRRMIRSHRLKSILLRP